MNVVVKASSHHRPPYRPRTYLKKKKKKKAFFVASAVFGTLAEGQQAFTRCHLTGTIAERSKQKKTSHGRFSHVANWST